MNEQKWLNKDFWVSEFNWLPEVRGRLDLPEKVWIHECTLREAEQAPEIVLKPDEKIALARALDKLGVSSLEIFPVVSGQDMEVAKELIQMNLKAQIRCLARWLIKDIDAALQCGAKAVEVENTCNPWVNKVAYDLEEDQIVENFVEATRYAKDQGLDVTVMPWDTYRCPLPLLERIYKSVVLEGGADRVVVADTSGVGLPWTTAHIITTIRGWVPNIPVEMHCHNEMGLATSVMLSAVAAGASGVHTTLCGYGTRGGNAATEEVITDLEILMGVPTGTDLKRIQYTCKLAQDLSKVTVPADKPIIGDNLYTYSTGLSVDMFHKMTAEGRPHGYVPIRPHFIGKSGYRIVMGKMAGKSAVRHRLEELGIEYIEDQLSEITERVKKEGILRKGPVEDEVLVNIALELSGKA